MKHLLTITELSAPQIDELLTLSKVLHADGKNVLAHKNIIFAFEKPSLRTKVGTEVAINHLGGNVIHIEAQNFFSRESMKDTVKNVSQWCDAVFARVFAHQTLLDMKEVSDIPIVNALCDGHHPMQALADLLTLKEKFGDTKLAVAFIGDANNVAFSLFEVLLKFGHEVRFGGPKEYFFSKEREDHLRDLAREHSGKALFTTDPHEAVRGVNAIYTDTFVSMGEEAVYDEKIKRFKGYQVNRELLSHADTNAVFMHCLPAHRGVEVTDEIMDSERSLIYEQAKNRMIVSKGVFAKLLV